MGTLIALLVLSVLIFLHELGHFLAAKFFGVQVEVFSIGFGKRLWTKKIGQTEWSLSAIPLGGYVRMKGQDDSDPTKVNYDKDSYTSKKPWQRIIILLAGPFANFLVAFVLYLAISFIGVPKLLSFVGEVGTDTPALISGLKAEDKIVAINGKKILFWEEIGEAINSETGDITITIVRNNKRINLVIKPKIIHEKNIFGEEVSRQIIGIKPSENHQTSMQYGLLEGLSFAWEKTKWASMMIFKSVQKMISGDVSTDQVGGILTIVDVTAQASNAGILALFFFTALISVNLGVLNLLPIPALDGGHIVFNLYEMVSGKAPTLQVMYFLTVIGWVLLLSLMILGLYNDINRIWG